MPGLEVAAKAEKALAEAGQRLSVEIKGVTDKLREQIATFNMSARAAELYDLKVKGATYAQRQKILSDQITLQSMKDYAAMQKIINDQMRADIYRSATEAVKLMGEDIEASLPAMKEMATDALGIGGANSVLKNSVMDIEIALQKQIDSYKHLTDAEVLAQLAAEGASKAEIISVENLQKELKQVAIDAQNVNHIWADMSKTMADGFAAAIMGGESLGNVFKNLGKQIEYAIIQEALLGKSGTGVGGVKTGGLFGILNQATGNILPNAGSKNPSGGIIGDLLGMVGIGNKSGRQELQALRPEQVWTPSILLRSIRMEILLTWEAV